MPKIVRMSTCHAERRYFAKGFCRQCYSNQYVKQRARPRKAGTGAHNPIKAKDSQLKHYYGISLEQYNIMVSGQDGVCAICKRPETINKSLDVDHCHLTNTMRGLLCTNCNIALGKMGDSIEILKSAIAYLEKCTLTN